MEYVRDRKSNVAFSLHDSRILNMEISRDNLSLQLDRIYQYADDEEKWHPGIIEFTKVDMEECDIMLFNTPFGYDGEKTFSGKSMSFEEFNVEYPNPG